MGSQRRSEVMGGKRDFGWPVPRHPAARNAWLALHDPRWTDHCYPPLAGASPNAASLVELAGKRDEKPFSHVFEDRDAFHSFSGPWQTGREHAAWAPLKAKTRLLAPQRLRFQFPTLSWSEGRPKTKIPFATRNSGRTIDPSASRAASNPLKSKQNKIRTIWAICQGDFCAPNTCRGCPDHDGA